MKEGFRIRQSSSRTRAAEWASWFRLAMYIANGHRAVGWLAAHVHYRRLLASLTPCDVCECMSALIIPTKRRHRQTDSIACDGHTIYIPRLPN